MISGSIKGIETLWVIGDEFVDRTFTENLHFATTAGEHAFIIEYYETVDFSTTQFASSLCNVAARLISLLVASIKKEKLLPKAIIVVLDDDILWQIHYEGPHLQDIYAEVTNYLVEQFHRICISYKEMLPTKTRQAFIPYVIWILPPSHINYYNNTAREKFAVALTAAVRRYPEMACLSLKKL